MSIKLKKFRCTNCGKIIEIPITAEDPIICPYCGMGPGTLVKISKEADKSQKTVSPNKIEQTMTVTSIGKKRFICLSCKKIIEVPFGVPKPIKCPYCGAPHYMIHRVDPPGKWWRRRGPRWGY